MTIAAAAAQIKAQLTAPGAPFELSEASINGQSLPVYRQAPQTLIEVIKKARREDDDCFLVYQEQRWSYKEFYQHVDTLASWLNQQGIKPGQRIAIAMRNRPEWVVAFVATALIGAVPAPLNSFGLEEELRAALDDLAPDLLICDTDRLKRLQGNTGQSQCDVLLVGDTPELPATAVTVTPYQSAIDTPVQALPALELKPEDPALVLFTSGATSRAKAVLSSQRAICQALYNIDYISAISAMTSPEALAKIQQAARQPVILTAVPLFHVSGLHAQLLTALRTGRRLVFMHRWDPETAIETIKQEKVTQFNGAPSMVMQLLREEAFFDKEIQDGFAGLGFGGAGLSHSIIDRVLSKLPDQMVGIGFGMTESNGAGSACSGELFRHQPFASGVVSPLIDVRICNLDGEALPAGETGEIWLRGATIMDGYLNNPKASAEALQDGWLRTGDLGYLNEDGFLFIVDRLKDVINRAGENIAAAEVESCLGRHPKVVEAAVFGVPDEDTGEAVVAVVSIGENTGVDEQQLRQHVAEHLASYKVPSKIHVLEESLPHNPAGKLLKAQLKQRFST